MSSKNAPILINSSSSEDFDGDLSIDHDFTDLDISEVASRRPHFLDYDAVPPPGFEEDRHLESTFLTLSTATPNAVTNINLSASSVSYFHGENVILDKKYERDGEISDYELAASGNRKKEQYQQQQQLHQELFSKLNIDTIGEEKHTGARKKKHFLDENPIPPDYMTLNEKTTGNHISSANLTEDGCYFGSREHRSLDRNFQRQQVEYMNLQCERKHSLDREMRSRKIREHGTFSSSRFLDSEKNSSTNNKESLPVDGHLKGSSSLEATHYVGITPRSATNLGPKVECVYSLLSMLGAHDSTEMSKKFLELSRSVETCSTLRRCGCIPLLLQMMHSDSDSGVRKRAALALHNVVHCHPDDKVGRREAKVLRLIEQIMDYCNFLKTLLASGGESIADDLDRHPLPAISSLMKVSFDEEHRHAMCQLGALQAIASLVHLDHTVHGPKPDDQCCYSLRRYALMALTNLTFGDGNNKAILCANKEFMESLVAQLDSAPDDLLQVTASVLRNLSWRADCNMKVVLNEIGTVTILAKAAMRNKNENTLKAILSALWNLSAHRSTNKMEFCAVEGALAFLVDMLTYEGPSKTLKIMENAGGILRNLSSHIAVNEDYRKILRLRNCLGILLQHLKSESLTVVSNACGILWNLSARCPEDQRFLWDNGAVPMLRSLIHSKHKMISEGSRAALKNLLTFRPGNLNQNNVDPVAKSLGLKELPSLNARKQKALEQELSQNLAQTCDNLDNASPTKEKTDLSHNNNKTITSRCNKSHTTNACLTKSAVVSKSDSRDSLASVKSDSVYEKISRGHPAPPTQDGFNKSEENIHQRTKSGKHFSVTSNFISRPSKRLEVETETEQPINYSVKYDENAGILTNKPVIESKRSCKTDTDNYTSYQETDLDQPTDFSLRYAENQTEFEGEDKRATGHAEGNEIILIMEDTIKCYQTEDTPYVISNAGSSSDLRNVRQSEESTQSHKKRTLEIKQEGGNSYAVCGTFTPEKPINYCEEGTPSYFSRYESLSSLDESPPVQANTAIRTKPEVVTEDIVLEQQAEKDLIVNEKIQAEKHGKEKLTTIPSASQLRAVTGYSGTSKNLSTINSAQETPLMFSRHSSMDSLTSVEPVTADDKSSVVSDFSRLASGIVSPSEIPDSPTQSMPQSPRRNGSSNTQYLHSQQSSTALKCISQTRLRSVFEDEVNTFQVENTPAQFSCATSLSNLSLEDEPKIASDSLPKEMPLVHQQSPKGKSSSIGAIPKRDKPGEPCAYSEDEIINDDLLLATCINIGMNRVFSVAKCNKKYANSTSTTIGASTSSQDKPISLTDVDVLKQYYTEDTPALLSKVGSNSNLSALSICVSKDEVINLSDESSNTSDGGIELLEQCIREGMEKSSSSKQKSSQEANQIPRALNNNFLPKKAPINDPIAMLRRGGLPQYLPVRDEMNKYVVEGSPCNISLMSGLSTLTIDSNIAGSTNLRNNVNEKLQKNETRLEERMLADDSISSISIESEEDTNFFTQAIIAGYNKPRLSNSKMTRNLSHSSLLPPSKASVENVQVAAHHLNDGNESLSSVDSSDLNENQAKTLLEQCIRTGMHKQRKHENTEPKPIIVSPKRSQLPTLSSFNTGYLKRIERDRQRDREKKDEQLLKECINTGIAKSTRPSNNVIQELQQAQPLSSRNITRQIIGQSNDPLGHSNQQRIVTGSSNSNEIISKLSIPKNEKTASVVVLEQKEYQEVKDKKSVTLAQSAPNTIPDVEMRESQRGTNNEQKNPHQIRLEHQQHIENSPNITGSEMQKSVEYINLSTQRILEKSNEFLALTLNNVNGSIFSTDISNEFLIEKSENDLHECFSSRKIKDSKYQYEDKQSEFLMQQQQQIIQDKHKDPDLMLKSVERLTQELVSTAEYLRTNAATLNNSDDPDSQEVEGNDTMYEKKSFSNSNSNNTWNEDTCPDDISFPSISLTVPMVASLNDDEITTMSDSQPSHVDHSRQADITEITPTNEAIPIVKSVLRLINKTKPECSNQELLYMSTKTAISSQSSSLGEESVSVMNAEADKGVYSNTNKSTINGDPIPISVSSNNGIQFQVGGKVQQQNYNIATSHQFQRSVPISRDISSTTMTSSTIIAKERNKMIENVIKDMTDSSSSLDLDNIQPPSCMETLSMSGCFEMSLQSPQLSRNRKKSLPAGLMARRAIGNGFPAASGLGSINVMSASMESVSSNSNIDNIKPPSLMDELLDSMVSVESITSEIVENQNLTLTTDNTNYGTAFSDADENSMTLQSCMDALLPTDYDSSGTPIPSDFSSCESTPRKDRNSGSSNNLNGIKRTLTPKQKRRFIKDRYKTYVVAADFMLKENFSEDMQNSPDYIEGEEKINVEIQNFYNHTPKEHQHIADMEDKLDEKAKIILTPQHKRQEDRSRFRAKEITAGDLPEIGKDFEENTNTEFLIQSRRRMTNAERFRTQTIVYDFNTDEESKSETPFTAINIEQESLTSTEEDSDELSSIRGMTKQFKYINESTGKIIPELKRTMPANYLLKGKLYDDETRTTTESDYNSMDCDQNSETESCEQNVSPCYSSNKNDKQIVMKIKPKTVRHSDKDSGTEGENFNENGMNSSEANVVKFVRGRKKQVYVSPYRKSIVSTNSTKNLFPKTQKNGSVSRVNLIAKSTDLEAKKNFYPNNIPKNKKIVAKTRVIINKTSFNNNINAVKSGLVKPRFLNKGVIEGATVEKQMCKESADDIKQCPKNIITCSATVAPTLYRQGTFIKDEPSNSEVPIVLSLPPSPEKISKLPTKTNVISSKSQSDAIKSANLPKISVKTGSIVSKLRIPIHTNSPTLEVNTSQRSVKKLSLSMMRPPRTAGAIGSIAETKSKGKTFIGVRKSTSVPTVPQRSNSNASLRSLGIASARKNLPLTTPPSRSNSNLTLGRPNISSRIASIASIWKKTDDSKKSSTLILKNTVKSSSSGTDQQKQNSSKPPLGRENRMLIRSSTFDNSPSKKNDKFQKRPSVQTMVQLQTNTPSLIASPNTATFTRRPKSGTSKTSKIGTFLKGETSTLQITPS